MPSPSTKLERLIHQRMHSSSELEDANKQLTFTTTTVNDSPVNFNARFDNDGSLKINGYQLKPADVDRLRDWLNDLRG